MCFILQILTTGPIEDLTVEILLLGSKRCVENILSFLGQRCFDVCLDSPQEKRFED